MGIALGASAARPVLFPLLCLLALASLLAGVTFGSVGLSLAQVIAALFGQGSELSLQLVWELRVPRVLAAFACGGLLAVSGVLLQVLLRNPLADPYVLGVSGGASAAALGALAAGLPWFAVNALTLAGALAAMGIVFGLGFRSGNWSIERLLLTGVALSTACGAVIALLLTLAPAQELRGMLFWLMGDLGHAGSPWPAWGVLAAVALIGAALGPSLNVMVLGENKARSLGVAVERLRLVLYVAPAIATAVAVLTAGAVGFVGLIVPHLVRLLGVSDHRRLLPASVLLGGSVLTVADTFARTVAAPQQLPVGALMAVIGVPALLFLLSAKR